MRPPPAHHAGAGRSLWGVAAPSRGPPGLAVMSGTTYPSTPSLERKRAAWLVWPHERPPAPCVTPSPASDSVRLCRTSPLLVVWLDHIFSIYWTFTMILIIVDDREPSITLAWLSILIFLPLIGVFFY